MTTSLLGSLYSFVHLRNNARIGGYFLIVSEMIQQHKVLNNFDYNLNITEENGLSLELCIIIELVLVVYNSSMCFIHHITFSTFEKVTDSELNISLRH